MDKLEEIDKFLEIYNLTRRNGRLEETSWEIESVIKIPSTKKNPGWDRFTGKLKIQIPVLLELSPRPEEGILLNSFDCITLIKKNRHRNYRKIKPQTNIPREVKVTVAQSCLTLCDPMDYTVHGVFQGRILEWVTFPFSRGSFQPRDWTQVSHTTGRVFTSWATREARS